MLNSRIEGCGLAVTKTGMCASFGSGVVENNREVKDSAMPSRWFCVGRSWGISPWIST